MKKFLTICVLGTILALSFFACKKYYKEKQNSSVFDAAAAKEWYYGVFKNSMEGISFFNKKEVKLPDWENGSYKKIGALEIVSFPLLQSKVRIPITGANAKETPGHIQSIAEGTLNRILFIKNFNDKIDVRIAQYIPTFSFLQKNNYDISKSFEEDFDGSVLISKPNGRRLTLSTNNKIVSFVNSNNLTTIKRSVTDNEEPCFKQVEICIWQKDCEQTVSGDVVIHEECGQWYNTGNCTSETVPCDETPQCQDGMTGQECACFLFQICNNDEECSSMPSVSDVLAGFETVDEEPVVSAVVDQNTATDSTKTYIWKTRFHKGQVGWNVVNLRRYDKFIKQKPANSPTWSWIELQHINVAKEGTFPPTITPTVTVLNTFDRIIDNGNEGRLKIDYQITIRVVCGTYTQEDYTTNSHEIVKFAN